MGNDDDDMDEFVDCDLDDLIYLLTQLVEPKITVPELKDLCSKWGIKPGSKVKKTLFTELFNRAINFITVLEDDDTEIDIESYFKKDDDIITLQKILQVQLEELKE